jgi:uncharacterized protein YuzE
MKIIYDRDVDAITITFRETTVTTRELREGLFLDLDAEGRLAGIEILDASKRLGGKDPVTQASLIGISFKEAS